MLRSLWGIPLLACAGSLPHPPLSPQARSALTPIETAPPPGRVETVPSRPPGADAWIDGEWVLQHGRWYWLLGRWVKVPAGATYCRWVVTRSADGTAFYAPSYWRDGRGVPMAPPPGIAFAEPSREAVFGSDGNALETGRSIKTAVTPRVLRPPGQARAR